jgi:Holliday junction DNA helicase RuvB
LSESIKNKKTDIEDDDVSLRPSKLKDFTGQKKFTELLSVYINSAKNRNDILEHCLFFGPPGLGKTTLATIVANELGYNFKQITAPSLQRPGDLAAILVGLEHGDILFIDEIHRLNPLIEEVLYPAMEDFKLNILTGSGSDAKTLTLDLQKFTLIGATTRPGMLSKPFRDRFGIDIKLELYDDDSLSLIAMRSSRILNVILDSDTANQVAVRSRGTPRLVNKLLKRLRDFTPLTDGTHFLTESISEKAFDILGLDSEGLDERDKAYLDSLYNRFKGKPVGIQTLSSALNEDIETLEEEIEPWLLLKGYIDKTPRGRVLTPKYIQVMNIKSIRDIVKNLSSN